MWLCHATAIPPHTHARTLAIQKQHTFPPEALPAQRQPNKPTELETHPATHGHVQRTKTRVLLHTRWRTTHRRPPHRRKPDSSVTRMTGLGGCRSPKPRAHADLLTRPPAERATGGSGQQTRWRLLQDAVRISPPHCSGSKNSAGTAAAGWRDEVSYGQPLQQLTHMRTPHAYGRTLKPILTH